MNCLQIIPEVPKFVPMTFEQIKSKNSLNQLSVVGVKKTSFGTFHQTRFYWKEDSNGSWLILSKTKMNQLTSSTTTQLQIKLVSIWERGLLVESQLSEIQNYWEGIRYTTGQELILDLNFKWHIMIKLKAFYGRKKIIISA